MVDKPPPDENTLLQLHLITHLDWSREDHRSFEHRRADLLATLATLLETMQQDGASLRYFMPGGQTILLEDIAAVQPDMLAMLAIYNAGGRLTLGPWYIQTDDQLVSGESLIRNLLHGRADIQRHNVRLSQVAYIPGSCEFSAQLPRILRGFEIDAVLLCPGQPVMPLPFIWRAPDNSGVLVMNYHRVDSPQVAIQQQRDAQPDGPFLWMYPYHSGDQMLPDQQRIDDVPIVQSHFDDYVAALRKSLPDGMRPVVQGEIRLKDGAGRGRLAARIPVRQMTRDLELRLVHQIEPLLTIALTHSALPYPQNNRALLAHAWRLLLKNQNHTILGGNCSDEVILATKQRNRQINDVSEVLLDTALTALPGQHTTAQHPVQDDQTWLVIWNPHNATCEQVVSSALDLPPGRMPATLYNPLDEEMPFGWHEDDRIISFRAIVPPTGYAVYRLALSDKRVPVHRRTRRVDGSVIGNVAGETLSAADGVLTWKTETREITPLLTFFDGGDAGDTFNYRKPEPDIMVKASMMDQIYIESGPAYSRLVMRHRMRVAPGLRNGGRTRGLRVLDLATSATFYDNTPGIYFRTIFTNTAGDHRLRAHLRTGIKTDTLLAGSPFALVERPLEPGMSQPVQGLSAVQDDDHLMALLSRGLFDVTAQPEDDQITLLLTLLRSVGQLSESTPMAVPRAQHMDETLTLDYMLLNGTPADRLTLLRQSQMYQAPLQVYQYTEPPSQKHQSYLHTADNRLLLTALKPPREGRGWIVRLVNPVSEPIETTLTTHRRLKQARLLNLAEAPQAEYELHGDTINISLKPQGIITLHLQFDS